MGEGELEAEQLLDALVRKAKQREQRNTRWANIVFRLIGGEYHPNY